MAQKRTLSSDEQHLLREALQSATITALMDSRRWQPGELAFQGGTCLSLAHGSVRFSEDLDFMVRGGLPLEGLSKEVLTRLRLPPTVAQDLSLSVSTAKDKRNPHAFIITLSGPNVIGSAKVKIELWQTDRDALSSLNLKVSQIRSSAGLLSSVPTLTIDEILADKVYALGARERIKPRDIYDLWWIHDTHPDIEVTPQQLLTRLDIYPGPAGDRLETSCRWLDSANTNLQNLASPAIAGLVAKDLKRWLAPSIPMDEKVAATMIAVAKDQLHAGLAIIQNQANERACDSIRRGDKHRG